MFAMCFATYLRYCILRKFIDILFKYPVFPIIYITYIQTKLIWILTSPKLARHHAKHSDRIFISISIHCIFHELFQMQHNWRERGGEKKTWRGSRRVFYSRFKLCDGHYGNNRSHISPAINSSYGISRVFTRIPATLRQQRRAIGKQRPRPY